MTDLVLVFTHTEIDFDSRIQRQVNELSKNYKVLLFCRNKDAQKLKNICDGVDVFIFKHSLKISYVARRFLEITLHCVGVKERLLSFFFRFFLRNNLASLYFDYRPDFKAQYFQALDALKKCAPCNVKAIVANDVFVLPIAERIKKVVETEVGNTPKLIGDMHEVHFNYSAGDVSFNTLIRKWLCETYVKECDYIISVSPEGARLYTEHFGIDNVRSVMNVAPYHEIEMVKSHPDKIQLVHVGGASPERQLEKMVQAVSLLDERFSLNLHLVFNGSDKSVNYKDYLEREIVRLGMEHRVRILPPVPPGELIESISRYDIGVFYLEPVIDNYKYALPNKLFEFIQARLAVVTTPILAMKEVIEEHDVGMVSSEYTVESFSKAIDEVSYSIEKYKGNSTVAAKIFNSSSEWGKVIELIK